MRVLAADEQLIASGCERYELGTAWCWYAKTVNGYDMSKIAVDRVDYAANATINRTCPFVMDIESFDIDTQYKPSLRQLGIAARRWKSAQPDRLIGFYRLVPSCNYWAPVDRNAALRSGAIKDFVRYDAVYTRWKATNDRNATGLLPLVDFLVASLYDRQPGAESDWRVYAEANISEALRVCGGKPVYGMLMPCFHDTTTAIPAQQWESMLQFVATRKQLAGLMIHYSPTYTAIPTWREPVIQLARESIEA